MISSEKVKSALIIRISGDLMGGTEELTGFKNLIFDAIEEDVVNIVVDLKEANWMNSSGLGMLITGLSTARSSGGDLKLANVSDRIRRPLEVTKLDSVFAIYNSVKDALSSF